MKRLGKELAGPILALAGIALIIIGIVSGELGVVLSKAVRICLECIGIG